MQLNVGVRPPRLLIFRPPLSTRLPLEQGCCQTNAKSSLFSTKQTQLGGQKLAPFEEGGVAVQLEADS
jgi:hypothetical protein